ncbi:MAG: glycosyltransferase family 4 protein [Solirubrobacterales bacterium]
MPAPAPEASGENPEAERGCDLSIYVPFAAFFFRGGASKLGRSGGGAELQMTLLAEGLVARGIRTSLIVFPIEDGPPARDDAPQLVERGAYVGDSPGRGKLAESVRIWRALAAADARAYLFRGSGPQLSVAAAFCGVRRRRLIFSAANDLDFDFERPDRSRFNLMAYRAALRRVDRVVVQREQQLELAREAGLDRLTLIPSFAEPVEPSRAKAEAFLWIGRLVDYKRPLEYVRLAESLPEITFRMVYFASDETRPALVAELEAAGGRLENLELLGQLSRGEVLDLIERTAAVISTSRAEGMPNVFLEAWSRGVPVISLEYDPDGQIASRGLGLVAGGSAERLREAALRVWKDGRRRAELGERGREYVRSVHSPESVANRWAELIRELISA